MAAMGTTEAPTWGGWARGSEEEADARPLTPRAIHRAAVESGGLAFALPPVLFILIPISVAWWQDPGPGAVAVTLLLPRAQERPSLAEEAPELLSAPLSRQTAVAEARFVNAAGETVARVPLYPAEDVPLFRLTDIFRAIFRDFLGMPPDG